jgi:hypothetical protein
VSFMVLPPAIAPSVVSTTASLPYASSSFLVIMLVRFCRRVGHGDVVFTSVVPSILSILFN